MDPSIAVNGCVRSPLRSAAGLEHTSASVNGQRSYTLRVTQIHRRDGGEWKVADRHGDTVTE